MGKQRLEPFKCLFLILFDDECRINTENEHRKPRREFPSKRLQHQNISFPNGFYICCSFETEQF